MKNERLPWRATAQGISPFSRIGACLLIVVACGASPAWAAGQDLRSSIDSAGSSMSRQIGEWLGGKPQPKPRAKATAKTATRGGRTTVPTAAPLPPPRPDVAEAKEATRSVEQAAIDPVPLKPANPASKPVARTPAPVSVAKPAAASQDKGNAPPDKQIAAAVPLPPARPEVARDAAVDEPKVQEPVAEMPASSPTPKAAAAAASAPQTQAQAPLPPARPFPAAGRERVAALPMSKPMEADDAAQEAKPAPVATICPELSNDDIGVFTPVTVTATQAACTVDRGVSLSAVRMKDGRLVPLEPAAVLRCEMAGAVARWLRESVDPLVATLGSPLDKVKVAASQQCRSRNRVAGAKISEHGRGNALDTAGYVLEDKREVLIGGTGDTAMTPDFQQKLKASACADFTTILGPGSDGYHEKHLHVDRAERRSGAVLCQWAVSTGKGR